MTRLLKMLVPFVAVVMTVACDDDTPTPTQPTPVPDPSPPAAATLSDVQTMVFSASCVPHHGPPSPTAGLDLSAGASFASLVNVTSPVSNEVYVIPGNAQDSYLVKKLENRQSTGSQMPFGRAPLSQDLIGVVRSWIDDGAPDN